MAGVAAQGQGHETALSQDYVADELGVDTGDVSVSEGDTWISPYGLGAWASRFAIAGVGSVMMACDKVKRKLIKDSLPQDWASKKERLFSREAILQASEDTSKTISISEIAAIAYTKILICFRLV